MRFRAIAVMLGLSGAAFAVANCGSEDGSAFSGGDGTLDAGGTSSPPPGFGGNTEGGAVAQCTPKTCTDLKIGCGQAGDGCGNIIECGTCAVGESCGGGGVASQCGKPACNKLTCTDLKANCGAQQDGCGGIIDSCGTCNADAGAICGGGGPSQCGTGVGDGGLADAGACVPIECPAVGANCGPIADGCGNLIQCGTCNAAAGETCGGGGIPSVCGKACTPLTTCPAGLNCGPIADGCGGVVSCGGACANPGDICGGGGQANVCGNTGGAACTGLCTQQTTCVGGGTTSISGSVFAPNGLLPIYGALVYVPNGPVTPFTTGVSCEQCGAASGAPLVSATTGPDGKFFLANVPVSSTAVGKVNNIPVVIQLGRWRKQFTVQTTACTNTVVDAASSSLPRNKSQGDIPLTAISTGRVDGLECVFRKLGIDDAEFTDATGNGRIRFYQENGAVITPVTSTCSIGGAACTDRDSRRACTRQPPNGLGGTCVPGGTKPATDLYNDPAELDKYDLAIFACRGGEQAKSVSARMNLLNYANKGGRVYATHYSYVWLYDTFSTAVPNPPPWGPAGTPFPWSTTADWSAVDRPNLNSINASLDTTFPKGVAFAQWLNQPSVGGLLAPLPVGNPPYVPAPQIALTESRHDVDAPVFSGGQSWLTTSTPSVQHYTFNTDITKPKDQQCGRVLFSDFHVTGNSTTTDQVFPAECNNGPMTAQEKVLAFMLFDLASCINTVPPQPPTCSAKTCTQQGIECGQAGDGCGNVITCPVCPDGLTCGGGGVASKCGKPACTPKTCAANQCGQIADGCGGSVTCPACAPGQVCGGGGPNLCGAAACTALTCNSYPAGTCGPTANGCGGLLSCTCPPGTPCVNGKCGAPTCTPKNCAQAGAQCGQVADGCGKVITCPDCLAPQTCGGGGTPNVCGGGVN